jgi:hypothetical protein
MGESRAGEDQGEPMGEISRRTVLLMAIAIVVLGATVIVLIVELGAQQSHIDALYAHVNFLRSFDESLLIQLHSLVHTGVGAHKLA